MPAYYFMHSTSPGPGVLLHVAEELLIMIVAPGHVTETSVSPGLQMNWQACSNRRLAAEHASPPFRLGRADRLHPRDRPVPSAQLIPPSPDADQK